jgi:serine/threonine-protein phosphatase CPPED1
MARFAALIRILKRHPMKAGLSSVCFLLFIALQIWTSDAPLAVSNRNEKEISRIKVEPPGDYSFVVFGDNKDGYAVFEALLKDIGHRREASFAVDLGDLVPKGERNFFLHFIKQVQRNLALPLVTVIGNHDLHNLSADTYREIFGATYYSFQAWEDFFIVLSATGEAGLDRAERHWLEEELKKAQNSRNRFVFMHVPPLDPRGEEFHKCLSDGKVLLDLFRRYNVTHLFASHLHGYFSGLWEGVPYTITGGAGAGLQGNDPEHFFHHYVVVRVQQGKVETIVRRIDAGHGAALLLSLVEGEALEVGLLVVGGISLLTLLISIKKRA